MTADQRKKCNHITWMKWEKWQCHINIFCTIFEMKDGNAISRYQQMAMGGLGFYQKIG